MDLAVSAALTLPQPYFKNLENVEVVAINDLDR